MPKKPRRHKPRDSQFGDSKPRARRSADSVKDLLARAVPVLTRVSEQAVRQKNWEKWLSERLPPEASKRLSGVVERGDALVVFTESAAWSARLRYALAELEKDVRAEQPQIARVIVRVLPRVR